jgi:hypothetical protein
MGFSLAGGGGEFAHPCSRILSFSGLTDCLTLLNRAQCSVVRCNSTTKNSLLVYSSNKTVFWYTIYKCLSLHFSVFEIVLIRHLTFLGLS